MARLRFADLLPLYRNTQFGEGANDEAEVTVATQEIADLLTRIDTDQDAGSDAGIVVIDDIARVHVGAKIRVRIDSPRIALGLLARDIGDLVAGNSPRIEEPKNYFLIDARYAPGDAEVPDAVFRYRKMIEIVCVLAKAASFLDPAKAELIFVKEGKTVVPVKFGAHELTTFEVADADRLLDQFADDLHCDQKLSILFETLVDLCRLHQLEGRFSFIVRNLGDIADKLAAGYRMFASSFSYAKIKGELEDARIDYTQKIHRTIVDIQNQLLGIPVATIVVASQLKAPTIYGPEIWVNFAVLVGAWIFVVLLLVAIANQWLTLNVIGDEIGRQQTKLQDEFAAVSGDFTNTFRKLKGRIVWHRLVLAIVATIGIVGGGVATHYHNKVSGLSPHPSASALKQGSRVEQVEEVSPAIPPANEAANAITPAPKEPIPPSNGSHPVDGNPLETEGRAHRPSR